MVGRHGTVRGTSVLESHRAGARRSCAVYCVDIALSCPVLSVDQLTG